MNIYPRSMLHNLARSSIMSMGISTRYGLRSYSQTTSSTKTPKLQLKGSTKASTSSGSQTSSTLRTLYKDQLTEQARADVRAGVSQEDGRKRAATATPLLKYLSTLGGPQFQKEFNEIYDEAYQTAKADQDAGTLEAAPSLDVKV